jgi:outer membrane protein TolC
MRYVFIAFLLISGMAGAQTVKKNFHSDTIRITDIREKLVQLAMQGPTYEILDHNSQAALYGIRIAKSAYLGLFAAQANVNEWTIFGAPQQNGTAIPYYYPKYNFSLNVPFDIFTRTTNSVKIAKENYMITTAAKNAKFREIKADILTKYENYLMAKQLVELQGKTTQARYATLKRAESDFGENLIKLDEVEKAQDSYNSEQVKSLTLQRDLNITKIEIQKVIGIRIEDVEKGFTK